ncbi:uncharacterized protein KNAG_0B02040 [Huiozyma naganishii CBS 8797]|uniref:Uncharacterized protein n=1 Tax=Huiozyma naganishii (strain ATCC MYA-139 / BCRC 22969 / CBS 8797 / KCTC 17520 / NBRC 10181 / NCYC 3082 / Yp74L-3) TaxID=1071383 RepID=J7S4L3_HUIN7|nr:hypothetical protein KNAG_0B02040 [Kazachstania naganishii CBS 8797]CCK68646.1 hypothetical protein KNAG_0B02040 [Kazachstania naganishii CBS 8797]
MRSARTVPHMQSIWIDQNQYMEKLYGCQMDQLFDATTTVSGTKIIRLDAFDDHETDIHILNSSIPILGSNTNFIDLSASHRLIPQPKNPARKGSTPVKTPIIQWDKIRRVAKECQKFITNPKVKLGNKKGKHSKTVSKTLCISSHIACRNLCRLHREGSFFIFDPTGIKISTARDTFTLREPRVNARPGQVCTAYTTSTV